MLNMLELDRLLGMDPDFGRDDDMEAAGHSRRAS